MDIIRNNLLPKTPNLRGSTNVDWIDAQEILDNATYLQLEYGKLSSFHSIYFDIIKDIQINLLEKIKNNKFDEPFFIACTTSNFVKEITNDLKNPTKSQINRQITKLRLQNPLNEAKVIESKLDIPLMYDFLVNYMSNLEDNLRAFAMSKAGKSSFTPNDKNQIVETLVTVILAHSKALVVPKNIFGIMVDRLSERIIKIGMKYIGLRHLNNSISISKALLGY